MIRPMLRIGSLVSIVLVLALGGVSGSAETEPATGPVSVAGSLDTGDATPQSISVLLFAPDGTLFLGDGKGGAVFAVALPAEPVAEAKPVAVQDIEAKVAARLGTQASEILIHDLAVHPTSHEVYLSVSRGRAGWDSVWKLPNHVADADILLKVDAAGTIEDVPLTGVDFARVALPNPVKADKKHAFMQDLDLRTDTITDLAFTDGMLFVAGLSNEEFASTLWRIPLPFGQAPKATTLEVYHGAHGTYETHAPIRTFVPYVLNGEEHILAAYLCTPLSLFKVDDLAKAEHLKGRTIAELGSGNYPLDIVVVKGETSDRLIMANSNLPLIVIDTADIAAFEGSITERPEGYTAGVEHLMRSGIGIQQLDVLDNRFLVTLQRTPSGKLDLGSLPLRRG